MFYRCNASLSPRETEIASWLLRGHTSKEIAKTLDISNRTVETHINNIRLKLGARNRANMAAHLILRDLVPITAEDLKCLRDRADRY